MHHYFEAITNRSGDSLIGYFARVIDPATLGIVTLSADNNGTPIITVSGVADMAVTDENGNISLYVQPGTYHLDIYQPDATTFIMRVPNVAMNSTKGDQGDIGPPGPADAVFTSLSSLKAINPATYPSPRLAAPSGSDGGVANGAFTYQTGNLTGRAGVIAVDGIPLSAGGLVPQGAESLAFRGASSAAIYRDAQAKARERVSALDFGAIGDGTAHTVQEWIIPGVRGRFANLAALQAVYPHVTSVNDYIDWAAIQAGLDWLGSVGSGCLYLPGVDSFYLVNRGLKMPSYVSIEGDAPVVYPFNAGAPGSASIVADLDDPLQWVIEPKTTHNGQAFAYNEMTTAKVGGAGGLPNGPTYNCSVRNLSITSIGPQPYGAIRMHGCPGSTVSGVGVVNVSCGLLVNCCFGGFYQIHGIVANYGVVGWDDVNGNVFQPYVARMDAATGNVPTAYLMPFMSTLNGQLIDVHGLASNDHWNRATGIILGSLGTTSSNNAFDYVIERFQTDVFALYAYGAHFRMSYKEGTAGQTMTAVAGARSRLKFATFHAYLSGTGQFFDTGFVHSMDVTVNSITFAASFGRISMDTASYTIIRGPSFNEFGPDKPQFNIVWEKVGLIWNPPTLQNSWAGVDDQIALYRKEQTRVRFDGTVTGGAANSIVMVLPLGYRPPRRCVFPGFYVTPSGEVVATQIGPLGLGVINYEAIP